MEDRSRARNVLDVLDDRAPTASRFLHVLNGDSVRGTLERSDLPGVFSPYADILHEGPVPRATGTPAWRETRARYIAASGYAPYAEALRKYEEWDEQLARAVDYDEVVLWLEHDLFDQLLLVRHLDWFSRRDRGATTLSLICIGEFPGIERFDGLGQLDPDQLASLLGTRQPVTAGQLEAGRTVWQAFTAYDPGGLNEIARAPDPLAAALPFLPGALHRFFEEYPAVDTGLPRTERHILECLSNGPMTTERLFRAEQQYEERVFMGDWTFWSKVRALAAAAVPLLSLDVEPRDGPGIPPGTAAITDAGRDVLAGRADAVRLNGFDRWLGGVHLVAPLGGDVAWRYDARIRGVVRT